jgi:signal transduction histidine kinase
MDRPPAPQAGLHGRVLERFFRGHPDAAEGTGLGLAIVREASQQLESRLEFQSEPGGGTTFRFLLPPAEREPGAGT